MAAVLHGSARTTPRVRAELQAAQTSSRALAAQYSLNPKTVLKWRKRSVTVDAPMGPKPRSTGVSKTWGVTPRTGMRSGRSVRPVLRP